jgi:hypothetical protein
MLETSAAITRRNAGLWRLTFRDRLVLISAAVLGLYFGIIERDWFWGGLAAISLCIAVGLAAQVYDLWRGSKGNEVWTSEERWGWRFAVVWRPVVICLMVVHFLLRALVKWKLLALAPGRGMISPGVSQIHDAVLLVAMFVAMASSPCIAERTRRRSWLADLLVGVAACVFSTIFVKYLCLVPVLVHITIAGIEIAQPFQFSTEALAAYDAKRLNWFFDITTAGPFQFSPVALSSDCLPFGGGEGRDGGHIWACCWPRA